MIFAWKSFLNGIFKVMLIDGIEFHMSNNKFGLEIWNSTNMIVIFFLMMNKTLFIISRF